MSANTLWCKNYAAVVLLVAWLMKAKYVCPVKDEKRKQFIYYWYMILYLYTKLFTKPAFLFIFLQIVSLVIISVNKTISLNGHQLFL